MSRDPPSLSHFPLSLPPLTLHPHPALAGGGAPVLRRGRPSSLLFPLARSTSATAADDPNPDLVPECAPCRAPACPGPVPRRDPLRVAPSAASGRDRRLPPPPSADPSLVIADHARHTPLTPASHIPPREAVLDGVAETAAEEACKMGRAARRGNKLRSRATMEVFEPARCSGFGLQEDAFSTCILIAMYEISFFWIERFGVPWIAILDF
ncbi:hypothetical protein BRADI_4g36327v3 [Brachypodium distachyon]|uniref:Uncharacterized protein n=1 Tax=Brachypodium distachyon TaxID=15368 RepID=A0A2K2CSM8_BRADI|nr:hypothetical protein BRADI_4g36327v3 [Brachypodium distachyon]